MAKTSQVNGASNKPSLLLDGRATGHSNGITSLRQQHEAGVMPVAIIGMACRFPGDSSSPAKLWDMLANKRSGWSRVPAERFTQTSFEHPSSGVGGTVSDLSRGISAWTDGASPSSTHKEHISWPKTFHCSTRLLSVSAPSKPRSVHDLSEPGLSFHTDCVCQSMDPQMRLQLEVAYESLENGPRCCAIDLSIHC